MDIEIYIYHMDIEIYIYIYHMDIEIYIYIYHMDIEIYRSMKRTRNQVLYVEEYEGQKTSREKKAMALP